MIKKFDFDKIQETKKILQRYKIKKVLLAISGGIDSVVLFHFLKINFPQLEMAVVHVHHGLTKIKKTNLYRQKALSFSKKLATKNGLSFYTNKPLKVKSRQSESELRKLREDFFDETLKGQEYKIIVKAQHRDDLFETRLIRLIRGSGPEGLSAMSAFDKKNLRPLLNWSKSEIENYAQHYQLKYIQDPSNRDVSYLRNWIRNNWLEDLECYRPGSRSSFMRSLENLAESLRDDTSLYDVIKKDRILREDLFTLTKSDQKRVVAHYLNGIGVKGYTSSQISEVLKRLDTPKKKLTFRVAGCLWTVGEHDVLALQRY